MVFVNLTLKTSYPGQRTQEQLVRPVELSLEPVLHLKQLVLLVVHSLLYLKLDKLGYVVSVDRRPHDCN